MKTWIEDAVKAVIYVLVLAAASLYAAPWYVVAFATFGGFVWLVSDLFSPRRSGKHYLATGLFVAFTFIAALYLPPFSLYGFALAEVVAVIPVIIYRDLTPPGADAAPPASPLVEDIVLDLGYVVMMAAALHYFAPWYVLCGVAVGALLCIASDWFDESRSARHYAASLGFFAATLAAALFTGLSVFLAVAAVTLVAATVYRHLAQPKQRAPRQQQPA